MWNKIVGKIYYWLADYIWDKSTSENIEAFLFKSEKPFYDDIPILKDEEVKSSYITGNKRWDHLEYIKICRGKFFIDPQTGLLIDEENKILEDSIVIDHKALYPYYFSFKRKKAKNTKQIHEAILFDYIKGHNYFHFYSDVLGKLYMINNELPQLKHLPLLVAEELYHKRHFQFFLKLKPVSEFNWYVHKKNEIIEINTAYLLQPMPYDAKYWKWIRSICKQYILPQHPGKKIFINRPPATGRHIDNHKEIHQLVRRYGYEIVEMENKTIEEQIALFSSSSHIISIHGAGMTNLVYCHNNTQILEVMPNERISSHYYWVAKKLGLNYECILGGNLQQNRILYPKGKFYLDPERLQTYIETTPVNE